MADLARIKQLREETQASVSDCRQALEETNGDYTAALAWIKKRSAEKAEKKADRETTQGLIEAYVHNGKLGVMVALLCETDFVAKTDDFKKLAHDIALQIAAMRPESVEVLLQQEFIRDSSITMEKKVKEVIGKLGENITIKGFTILDI